MILLSIIVQQKKLIPDCCGMPYAKKHWIKEYHDQHNGYWCVSFSNYAYCNKLIAHGIGRFFVEFGSGSHTKVFYCCWAFSVCGWTSINSIVNSFTRSVAAIQHLVFTFLENVDSAIPWTLPSRDTLTNVFIELSYMPTEVSTTQLYPSSSVICQQKYPQPKCIHWAQ